MEAVIYARISADPFGQGLGVARQVQDCTAKATALGWSVAEVFEDHDTSASKDVPRPEYDRLLAGIESGNIKGVVVYDLDRLTRKPAELETFIDLTEKHSVALANVSGDVDLTTANGKMIARIKGAVARQEADRIAERTTRQKQQRVEAGKPLGQRFRTFGYERDWTVNDDEAEIVREVFERTAAGESQRAITNDLRERRIQTAAGGDWLALNTSRLLKTSKYAGFQTYKGKVIGKSSVVPALVTEAQYEAAQGAKSTYTSNVRKYLLSGFLICDNCKNPMSGTRVAPKGKESVRYRCDARAGGCGRVSIKAEWVDDVVNRYCAWWMSNEAAKEREAASTVAEDNSAEIADIDSRIETLQEAMGTGAMGIEDAMAAIKAARTQRNSLMRADAARVKEDASPRFFGEEALDYWDLPNEDKRFWVAQAFKFIFVKPGTRSRSFDISRLYVLTTFMGDQLMPLDAFNTYDLRDNLIDWLGALSEEEELALLQRWGRETGIEFPTSTIRPRHEVESPRSES